MGVFPPWGNAVGVGDHRYQASPSSGQATLSVTIAPQEENESHEESASDSGVDDVEEERKAHFSRVKGCGFNTTPWKLDRLATGLTH